MLENQTRVCINIFKCYMRADKLWKVQITLTISHGKIPSLPSALHMPRKRASVQEFLQGTGLLGL